ncbi:MAG TPA: glycosyltransferase family 39 protein [Pyrinomonadaceae bacterium]|jgi:4-amino-4-deoxy-L-arabinose transferase-like glycosyltransferase|nr:glycosyltransferase family 39 protein [Pyrinomonadaceae bacterium]
MDESLEQERASAPPFGGGFGGALREARAWAAPRASALSCAGLLAVMTLNMLATVARKSITNDETVLIPAAYYHLAAGDFQHVSEHPPLCKLLAGVPLLFVQPNEAPADLAPDTLAPTEVTWAYQEKFWDDNKDIYGRLNFWPRLPMILLTVALGVVVFLFARELFGERAAVFAVFLFSVEPTVLAHGRVVQTDIPAAFGYLLTFYALRRHRRGATWKRAAWVGAAAGVALLGKYSMLLLGPVLAAYFVALFVRATRRGLTRRAAAGQTGLALAALVVVVNAAYFFQSRPFKPGDVTWARVAFEPHGDLVLSAERALSYVLPTDFVLGVFWQMWHGRVGHPAGFLGMYSDTGWWYYFPVAFALKTTLPFLLLSLAALGWASWRYARTRDGRFLFVLVPFALYTAFVMLSTINIGVRYYLPAYPFLFVACGALLDWLLGRGRRKLATACVAAVLALSAFEAARAFPDHMTYVNQLASARPHWWYLSDSNVEWGDDLWELAEFLRERGETRVSIAALGNARSLWYEGISAASLLALKAGEKPETRYAVVGASFLNGSVIPRMKGLSEEERVNFFDSYRRREPEAVIGGLYVYREDGR